MQDFDDTASAPSVRAEWRQEARHHRKRAEQERRLASHARTAEARDAHRTLEQAHVGLARTADHASTMVDVEPFHASTLRDTRFILRDAYKT